MSRTKALLPLKLPLGEVNKRKPVVVDSGRTLLLPDLHSPFHSKRALSIAVDDGVKTGVGCVILTGDQSDFYQMSRYEKDPSKRSVAEELEVLKGILAYIREQFPEARILALEGNHDARLSRYVFTHAPALAGLGGLSVPEICGFEDLGIEYVTGMRGAKIGNLRVFHGNELGINSGANPARSAFLKTGRPTIIGHLHKTSQYVDTNVDGEVTVSYSMGSLCDLSPDYGPVSRWNHGYAIIELDGKHVTVHNKHISKNGRVC